MQITKYFENKSLSNLDKDKFLLLSISLFFLATYYHGKDFYGIDLDVWRRDADQIVFCVQRFRFPCDDLSKFPLGYTINAFIMRIFQSLGIWHEKTFTLINFIFSSIPILFIFMLNDLKKFKLIVPIYIFSILSSSLFPFYFYSGAVEFQSAVILGVFSASLCLILQSEARAEDSTLERFLCYSSFLLPLYKDTNLIVIIIGLFSISFVYFVKYNTNLFIKLLKIKSIRNAASYLIFGVLLQLFYNYFKYQSVLPVSYLNEAAHNAPSYYKSGEYLFWTVFSPNGGVLCFWSFSIFTTIVLIKISKMSFSRMSVIYSCSLVIVSAVGLSRWWGPFGWDCWGDRLIIPAIFGSLICLISTADFNGTTVLVAGPIETINSRLVNYFSEINIRFIGVMLCIILCFLVCYSAYYTYISYVYDRNELLKNSLFNFESCKALTQAFNNNLSPTNIFQSHFYYDCVTDRFKYIPR